MSASVAFAAPDYQQTMLTSIYPAGGGRGQTVEVVLTGNADGLAGASDVLIDGPPGVTVRDVKLLDDNRLQAAFEIAADAPAGRRMVRVKGGVTGLTNFRWFFVSPLAEHIEKEKNNTLEAAEEVATPTIINGRVNPALDQDCFRFQAKAGQPIVAAVASHRLDAMGFGRNDAGFADTSLELLDESGSVIAEAGDTLGFDPVIQLTAPKDGWYTARVSGMGYKGFPEMIYRLTLGDVPYPTAVFPTSGRLGETLEIELTGPNVPPGTRRTITIDDEPFPVQYITLDGVVELPLLRTEEATHVFANHHAREAAAALPLPGVVSGRFEQVGQQHWYRVHVEKDQGVLLEILAQQHLRAPVDTLIEVFDAAGEPVAKNDDGAVYAGECSHEFVPFDSHLTFRPKTSGDYFVCVSEQSGAAGPTAVYQLTAKPAEGDFRLVQWPDALPVFGPGATAALVVEVHRLAGFEGEVDLRIEGLPAGWRGSTATAYFQDYREPSNAFGHKLFLTITAPESAEVGEMHDFSIVGRARDGERTIEHTAQPLTHYTWGQPNRFRVSPRSRVVVARPTDLRLEAGETHITAKPGDAVTIPVRLIFGDGAESGKRSLSLNRAGTHFKCALGPPQNVDGGKPEATVTYTFPESYKPGRYFLVVADGWNSETRKGLPGPCTQLITVDLQSP
ncbi:MAG: PPC domain-containing protein [Pirellulaceae bacterium]